MQAATDKRNRTAVFLYKSERPTTKFFCWKCKNFLAELSGTEAKTLTDVLTDPAGVSIRCSGSIEPGVKCHQWYIFNLGSA